jgi:hypothetical protein
MIKPISLRIRAAQTRVRAHQVLRRADEKDRLERRIKWLATRAVTHLRQMKSEARALAELKQQAGWSAPANKSIDADWMAKVERIEAVLLQISRDGR